MKLFYIVGTREAFETGSNVLIHKKVALIEELSSEYDSSCIETELSFESEFETTHTKKLALFTAQEVELLMNIKNNNVHWGSSEQLKGMSFRHFDRLFGYVDNVEVKEAVFNIF